MRLLLIALLLLLVWCATARAFVDPGDGGPICYFTEPGHVWRCFG